MDSSSTHHDHRCSTTHHRLIIDASWSSIFTDLLPTNHWLIIDASPIFTDSSLIFTKSSLTHHRFFTNSSPIHQRLINVSSPIYHHSSPIYHHSSPFHHRLITDSSPTHHWRIMIIDFHRLIIDASIYTDSSHSAATTFCSDYILHRWHSAPTTFCNKYELVDFEWKTNNNIMNVSKCCILFMYTNISLSKWAIQEQKN